VLYMPFQSIEDVLDWICLVYRRKTQLFYNLENLLTDCYWILLITRTCPRDCIWDLLLTSSLPLLLLYLLCTSGIACAKLMHTTTKESTGK
jgi:hypothetical protein